MNLKLTLLLIAGAVAEQVQITPAQARAALPGIKRYLKDYCRPPSGIFHTTFCKVYKKVKKSYSKIAKSVEGQTYFAPPWYPPKAGY